MNEDEIINALTLDNELETDRTGVIQDYLEESDANAIAEKLFEEDLSEKGGQYALRGFYYQFLATIERFVDVLEGKWDFIAFELHDDIVLGNEEEGKIKFIQVKTHKEPSLSATDISQLYNGSLKTTEKLNPSVEKATKIRLKNSWVDKLLIKSSIFKDTDYKIEFELLTSFKVLSTPQMNLDRYLDNKEYSCEITADDDLLNRINDNRYLGHKRADGSIYYEDKSYLDLSNKDVNSLLSNLHIKTNQKYSNLDNYSLTIMRNLGDYIFRDHQAKSLSINYNHLNYLIGLLFSRCKNIEDHRCLILYKADIQKILIDIKETIEKDVEKDFDIHGNLKIITTTFSSILEEHNQLQLYSHFETQLLNYKKFLLDYIHEEGSIRQIYSKYTGARHPELFDHINELTKIEQVKKLLTLLSFTSFFHENKLKFISTDNLLSKYSEVYNQTLIFYSPTKRLKIEEIESALNQIFDDMSLKESLNLRDENLFAVLENYKEDDFLRGRTTKIWITDDQPKNQIIGESSIKKVPKDITLLPGNKIKNKILDLCDEDNSISVGSESLNEHWKGIL